MIDLPHNLSSSDYVGSHESDLKRIELNRQSIEFAREFADEFSMSDEAFNIGGKVNAAATGAGLRHNFEYAQHLDRLGEPYEFLDAKQMHEISGSNHYLGGLATPGNAMIKPAMYFQSLSTGITRERVQIFENSPAVNFEKSGNVWTLKTPTGSVEAANVILTVNGHLESFGYFKRRLMHIYLYGSMTRRLSGDEVKILGGQPQWGFTPADTMGTTVRRISGTGGDRLIIRNGVTWAPSRSVPVRNLAKAKKQHEIGFIRRFPNLKNVTMQYTWGGLLCLSRNSTPAFGELEPGLFSACCQNGLGASHGTLHGKLIAELAAGYCSDALDAVMQLAKPSKLPPEPFASIGAHIATRWGEFKAGKER